MRSKASPVIKATRSENKGWEEVSHLTVDADYLSYTWPKERIAVLARPGMVASIPHYGSGKIETITAELCIVRLPNGEAWPARWGEVSLECIAPDPSHIVQAPDTAGVAPIVAKFIELSQCHNPGGEVLAQRLVTRDDGEAVRVLIRADTERADAIRSLIRILASVSEFWPRLLHDPLSIGGTAGSTPGDPQPEAMPFEIRWISGEED